MDQPVSLQDVVKWVRESLTNYEGLYDVQDLTFVRSMVRVVTPRRDAFFDLVKGRWQELGDAEMRARLTADLQRWARQHLAQRQPV